MSRARRARQIAAAAAYGGGGAAALGALGYGILHLEARLARRIVGQPFDGAPDDDGLYGAAPGPAIQVIVLGDSTAAGMGAENRYETVGAILATGLAAIAGRPVELTNEAVIGAEASDLDRQLAVALSRVDRADAAVILIGANDVTHRIDRVESVRSLARTVASLHSLGIEVVVGTCPDLGTIKPIPFPLNTLLRKWSRDLAAAQTIAVVEAGGRTVSVGDLLGAEFAATPTVMFSKDQFHPSAAGYARVASALLPSVCAALGLWQVSESADRAPEPRRGESIGPVAEAAGRAVVTPGTEVTGTQVAGLERGPRGRWAVLLRRPHLPIPAVRGARRSPGVPPVDDAKPEAVSPPHA